MGLTKSNYYSKPKVRFETSWDDGHKLDLRLAGLFRKHQIPAVFYIVIENPDKEDHLNWDQIKELDQDKLFEIGCHTKSHPQDMKTLHDDFLFAEIDGAKVMLESILDRKVSKFCYPRGRYDERAKQQVIDSGFLQARTTNVNSLSSDYDPFEKPTTIHVFNDRKEYYNRGWFDVAVEKLNVAIQITNTKDITLIPTYHLWGHSWEIDRDKQWDKLEEFLRLVNEKTEIV